MEARIGNRDGGDVRETLPTFPPPSTFKQWVWCTNEDTHRLLTCKEKTKLSNEISTYSPHYFFFLVK
jgi:hypothetical protein